MDIGRAVGVGTRMTTVGTAIGIEITAIANVNTPAGEKIKMNSDSPGPTICAVRRSEG